MDLTSFKKVDKTISETTKLCLITILIMAVTFVCCLFRLSNKIDQLYETVPVVDASTGRVFDVSPHLAADLRKSTYRYRVEEFAKAWYGFDEETYHKNTEAALNWIGNRGKQLQNEYNDIDIFKTLYQNNIRYEVAIDEVFIDMNTIPVSGHITFTQIGYRAKGSASREVYAEFTLIPVTPSDENRQGAKIEDWKVKFSDFKERD